MHNFTPTDVCIFWAKMCKRTTFLYFVKLFIGADVIALSTKYLERKNINIYIFYIFPTPDAVTCMDAA